MTHVVEMELEAPSKYNNQWSYYSKRPVVVSGCVVIAGPPQTVLTQIPGLRLPPLEDRA